MLFYLFFSKILTCAIFIKLPGHQWIHHDSWDILHKYFSGKFNIIKDID